jgi:hypothetical protein
VQNRQRLKWRAEEVIIRLIMEQMKEGKKLEWKRRSCIEATSSAGRRQRSGMVGSAMCKKHDGVGAH